VSCRSADGATAVVSCRWSSSGGELKVEQLRIVQEAAADEQRAGGSCR
jgi:hypothetical protein